MVDVPNFYPLQTKEILESMHSSYNQGKVDLSFEVPTKEEKKEELISAHPTNERPNIAIICQSEFRKITCENYNLLFIDIDLYDKNIKNLTEGKSFPKRNILRYFAQSSTNNQLIFILENDEYNVEITNLVNFLRDAVNSDVTIHIYFLSEVINDMFYSKLLLKKCICVTPFIKVQYGASNKTPEELAKLVEKQEEVYKSLPKPVSNENTEFMELDFFFKEVENVPQELQAPLEKKESETKSLPSEVKKKPKAKKVFSLDNIPSLAKSKNFRPLRKTKRMHGVLKSRKLQTRRLLEANANEVIEHIADFHFNMAIDINCKILCRILNYIKLVSSKYDLESSYQTAIMRLEVELKQIDNLVYNILWEKIKPLWKEIKENPREGKSYIVIIDSEENIVYEQPYKVYHFFIRLVVMILYASKKVLPREIKIKIAKMVLDALKSYLGNITIAFETIDGQSQLSGVELFKYYRQHPLL